MFIYIRNDATDGPSESYPCLETGLDGPKLQAVRPGSQVLIRAPQQGMQAVHDRLPEQEPPRHDRVHVQGVAVPGEF